jgi:tetratricopeptide (TPR) repeat protein
MLSNWVRAEELNIEERVGSANDASNRGQGDEAIAALEEIITQEPYYSRLAEAKLQLCEWFFRSEKWGRVAEYADELRKTVPARNGFELLDYYAGIALYEQGSLDQARRSEGRWMRSRFSTVDRE